MTEYDPSNKEMVAFEAGFAAGAAAEHDYQVRIFNQAMEALPEHAREALTSMLEAMFLFTPPKEPFERGAWATLHGDEWGEWWEAFCARP